MTRVAHRAGDKNLSQEALLESTVHISTAGVGPWVWEEEEEAGAGEEEEEEEEEEKSRVGFWLLVSGSGFWFLVAGCRQGCGNGRIEVLFKFN
jgi:hypothetical protein